MVSTAVGDETTQDMVDDAGSDIDDPIAGSDPDNARSPAAADDPPPGGDQLADAGAGGGGRRWRSFWPVVLDT